MWIVAKKWELAQINTKWLTHFQLLMHSPEPILCSPIPTRCNLQECTRWVCQARACIRIESWNDCCPINQPTKSSFFEEIWQDISKGFRFKKMCPSCWNYGQTTRMKSRSKFGKTWFSFRKLLHLLNFVEMGLADACLLCSNGAVRATLVPNFDMKCEMF